MSSKRSGCTPRVTGPEVDVVHSPGIAVTVSEKHLERCGYALGPAGAEHLFAQAARSARARPNRRQRSVPRHQRLHADEYNPCALAPVRVPLEHGITVVSGFARAMQPSRILLTFDSSRAYRCHVRR